MLGQKILRGAPRRRICSSKEPARVHCSSCRAAKTACASCCCWAGSADFSSSSASPASACSAPTSPAMPKSPARCSPEPTGRSEEHTSELQSRRDLVCRLLLEKKKKKIFTDFSIKTNSKYNKK